VKDLDAFRIGMRVAARWRRELQEFCGGLPPESRPVLVGEPEVEAKDGLVVITERVVMPPSATLVTLNIE
jgi:hypothetical protein